MEYEIEFLKDNVYVVREKDGYPESLFRGTIEEVNAWLSLKEKGYDI